jgi:hypothetical protein
VVTFFTDIEVDVGGKRMRNDASALAAHDEVLRPLIEARRFLVQSPRGIAKRSKETATAPSRVLGKEALSSVER